MNSLTRPRNRFGQFFANAFRPLSATLRRDSASTFTTTTTTATSTTVTSSEDSYILDSSSPIARVVQIPSPRDKLSYLQSIENLSMNPGSPTSPTSPTRNPANLGVRRSISATSSRRPPHVLERPLRRATASPGLPSGASNTTSAAAPAQSLWRFLPNLFSMAPAQSATPIESLTETPPLTQRKGDVVCLSYHTLDDRGMRRLEGRSDHRPVIGSYAVYV